jgi:RNA polymerase sigma factor (sigma-70 family)
MIKKMQLAILNTLKEKEIQVVASKELDCAYIFETYYKRVYNYIYYRINCHYTTEDLTSQVFEKIMLKISTYSESKAPFEVWLFSIARNVVNDYYRSQKKYKLFSIDIFKEFVSKEKNPEGMVLAAEATDKLSMALGILNTRERAIVALVLDC